MTKTSLEASTPLSTCSLLLDYREAHARPRVMSSKLIRVQILIDTSRYLLPNLSNSLSMPRNFCFSTCSHGYSFLFFFLSGRWVQETINIPLYRSQVLNQQRDRYRSHTNGDFQRSSEKLDWMICVYIVQPNCLTDTFPLHQIDGPYVIAGTSVNHWCPACLGKTIQMVPTQYIQVPSSKSHNSPLLESGGRGAGREATSGIPQRIMRQGNKSSPNRCYKCVLFLPVGQVMF